MEKSDELGNVDLAYLKLVEIALTNIFPDMPNQEDLASAMNIGKNTYYTLFKNFRASESTLKAVSDFCDILDYSTYEYRKKIIERLEARMLSDGGAWISYRLSSKRRMHKSVWKFEKTVLEKSQIESKREKVYSPKEYINVTKTIKHENHEESLYGELIINPDLTINIELKSEKGIKLNYYSVLFESEMDNGLPDELKYLLFEGTLLRKKKQYTQLEILIKLDNKTIDPTYVEDIIKFKPNDTGLPTNEDYLAFNFLTRNSGRTRRFLDNFSLNQTKDQGSYLEYVHDIFIACPISYLTESYLAADPKERGKYKDEYLRLYSAVSDISKVLQDSYGFQEDQIHCEILMYESIEEIPIHSRTDAFDSTDYINATHFIGIIPKSLDALNSGVYMEVYYRIQNKLPALLYVEENEARLPSMLIDLQKSRTTMINIDKIPIRDLSDIDNGLIGSKKHAFPFDFDLRLQK